MHSPLMIRRGKSVLFSFGLLAVLVLTACSGQAPAAAATSTTAPISNPTAAAPASTSAASTAGPTASQPAACTAPASLTPPVTEGPYFKAGSPERSSLIEAGLTGTQLTLTGYVLTADCKPVPHALLDFWQANAQGVYDNTGFILRGHLYTDANGRYQLVTIDPGLYPGRTEHIHVKVQAPGGPVLTTQLFFPGVQENQSDGIFTPALLVNVVGSGAVTQATFNFYVSLK